MLHTTRAVALRAIRHGDGSVVLRTYTEAFGARSYLVRTSGRHASRASALQPLTRLELVVNESDGQRGGDLHLARELRIERPFVQLHLDPERGVLALFTQEVLHRTLREEAPDQELFAFVQAALHALDEGGDLPHHALLLLVQLGRHMGFMPVAPEAGITGFDMREGQFFTGAAPHELCMGTITSEAFVRCLGAEFGGPSSGIPASARRALLDDLLIYYRLHVPGFGELRSPDVLHQVLR